ncbi:MAG TPA: hypothetical protein VFF64_14015 [Candidatus Eremiobacteraceae bacterium]|nr:hypothetical protein [Candidatus Eremiobacteraceae bacterium]
MNRQTPIRLLPPLLIAALVFTANACEKQKVKQVEEAPASDRVNPSPVGTTQTVLQKTFALKNSATFAFEIPPHAVRPHLHGIFESYVRELHGASDDMANVNFLILNTDQYSDLVGNRPSEALFSVDASHNQSVNLDLPASMDQPVKYYLVFRNIAGSSPSKVVQTDFQVDF